MQSDQTLQHSTNSSAHSPYETIGGEAAIRQLVDLFYQQMDTLPEATEIRAMHSPDLAEAKEKLFKFLSGWLGGPQLYMEEYGHPRLRARHIHFPINNAASDAWMLCMEKAIDEMNIKDALFRTLLLQSLRNIALHMRNR